MSSLAPSSELSVAPAASPAGVATEWSARQALAVLGVTSGVIVADEVLMTRLLSVVTWYGMAFFVLSIAMLRFDRRIAAGAAAQRAGVPLRDFVARRCLQLAPALLAALVVTLVVPMPADPSLTLQLAVLIVAAANTIPMVVGGSIVARIMAESRSPIGIVYAIDLTAAAAGALCPLLLLGPFDGVSALIALAALPALASAAIAADRRGRRRALALGCGLAAFAAMNNHTDHGLQIRFSKHAFADSTTVPQFSGWNALSYVQATEFAEQERRTVLWGPSPRTPAGQERTAYAAIDGEAGTRIHPYRHIEQLSVLQYDISNAVHWIRPDGPACVIGVGGGRDIESALYFGHDSVFAVEINPLMIDMLRQVRAESPILDDPRVTVVVGDGRSVIAARAPRCRTLQASLVDTWAATGAGAFAHTEATLYTREAWALLLQRVAPDGVLTFSRWYSPGQTSETARLLALATASLLERRVERPAGSHCAARLGAGTPRLRRRRARDVLVSPAPLSAEDIAKLRARSAELQFTVLAMPGDAAHRPGVAPDPRHARDRSPRRRRRELLSGHDAADRRSTVLLPAALAERVAQPRADDGGDGRRRRDLRQHPVDDADAGHVLHRHVPRRVRARPAAACARGAKARRCRTAGRPVLRDARRRVHAGRARADAAPARRARPSDLCARRRARELARVHRHRQCAVVALDHHAPGGVARGAVRGDAAVRAAARDRSRSRAPRSARRCRCASCGPASVTGAVGLVLGMLFPSGIRFVERDRGLPVALGLNGATSVVGSILSVLISIMFGIAASFSTAAVLYLIAAASRPAPLADQKLTPNDVRSSALHADPEDFAVGYRRGPRPATSTATMGESISRACFLPLC